MTRNGFVVGISPDRGFGFIEEDETGCQVFFHVKNLPDMKAPTRDAQRAKFEAAYPVGRAVVFIADETEKGLRAVSVRPR